MTINPTVKLLFNSAVIVGSAGLILGSVMGLNRAKDMKTIWAPVLTILISGSAIAYAIPKITQQTTANK